MVEIVRHDRQEELNLAKTQKCIQLTALQEKFCQLMADGFQQSYAYKELHPKMDMDNCYSAASVLMRRPHIIARVAQLRAEAIDGFDVSRNFLLESLLWALNTARERGSTDQVRKIIMDIGKLFGLVIEKSEADVLHRFQVMKDVTLNGNTLDFNIGDGKVIDVKGEKISEVDTAPAAIGSLVADNRRRIPEDIDPEQHARLMHAVTKADKNDVAPMAKDGRQGKRPIRRRPENRPKNGFVDNPKSEKNPRGAGRKKGSSPTAKVAGRENTDRKGAMKIAAATTKLTGEELL